MFYIVFFRNMFMGVEQAGVETVKLKMRYIGSEVDKEYLQTISRRY